MAEYKQELIEVRDYEEIILNSTLGRVACKWLEGKWYLAVDSEKYGDDGINYQELSPLQLEKLFEFWRARNDSQDSHREE